MPTVIVTAAVTWSSQSHEHPVPMKEPNVAHGVGLYYIYYIHTMYMFVWSQGSVCCHLVA
jgi:hypothetical protein